MYSWSYILVESKNRLSWFNHSELGVFVFNVSEDIVWKLSNTKQWHAEGLGCPGQRGSWMPASKKNCPVSIHLQKFLTTFFSPLQKKFRNLYIVYFLNWPPKIPDEIFLSRFSQFLPSFLNFFLDAPLILDAGAINFFLLLFMHLPLLFTFTYIFYKNSLVGCPPEWMPGPSPPPHPLCTPLILSKNNASEMRCFYLVSREVSSRYMYVTMRMRSFSLLTFARLWFERSLLELMIYIYI